MEKEHKKKNVVEEDSKEKNIKHENKHNELQKEIEELKTKLSEEQAKSMRIQAEMMNFKRRKEDEIANIYKYSNEELIEDLLPTIDNFERALKAEVSDEASDEVKKYLEGFKMIYTNLIKLLTDLGVKEIEASGIEFDPNYHQAVLTEQDESKPSNVILEVLQKGYIYKDKVIRPAMVKVNE